MGDINELGVKVSVDTHELVTANSGLRDFESEMRSVDQAAQRVATGTNSAAKSMGGLNIATAGVSRELVVLGHEVVSGNFSRIPGSILTLQSRMGGLNLAMVGITATVGAFGFALYEVIASAERTAESLNQAEVALDAIGRSGTESRAQLEAWSDAMSKLHGVNQTTADGIRNELLRSLNISQSSFEKMGTLVTDFAAVTGTKAPEAAKNLVKMFEDPMHAAVSLSQTYNGILTPAQFEAIEKFTQMGDKVDAVNVLVDAMSARFNGSFDNSLTAAQRAITDVGNAFSWLGEKIAAPFKAVYEFSHEMNSFAAELAGVTEETKKSDAANQQINATIVNALNVGRQFNDVLNKRAEIEGKIAQLKAGRDTAQSTGDTASAAKLTAEMHQAYNELANLRDQDVQKEASAISSKRSINEQYYQGQSELIRAQHDLKQNTTKQEYQILRDLLNQEWAAESKLYDQQMALYSKDSIAYQKSLQQKQLAYQKFQTQILRLKKQETDQTIQETKKDESAWKGYLSSTVSTFGSAISGYISGTETFGQAWQKILGGMVSGVVNAVLKMGEQWLINQVVGTAAAETQGATTIAADAAVAAAGAYAATAAIPFVGPILAPAAAATAYAATIAYEGLVGLDVGAWELPGDGVYQLHKGETVVPTNFADGLRENGGNLGGGGAPHFHIHAMDAKDVKRFFDQHGPALAHSVMRQWRNGNRGPSNRL